MEPGGRSKGRGLWHCIQSCGLGNQSSRLCMEAVPQCGGVWGTLLEIKRTSTRKGQQGSTEAELP